MTAEPSSALSGLVSLHRRGSPTRSSWPPESVRGGAPAMRRKDDQESEPSNFVKVFFGQVVVDILSKVLGLYHLDMFHV